MSRYTGPRLRKLRRLDTNLPGLTRKTKDARPFPPGQHAGLGRRPRRLSDYAMQLMEKQKLCVNYGVTENQMRRLFRDAVRGRGVTGHKLLSLLERRLDNAVFRCGLAPTIPAARQLVNHGHILVDGKRVDIPSFRVRTGQVISLRERSRKLAVVEASLSTMELALPDWLQESGDKREFKVRSLPDESSVPFDVDVQLVTEFYARLV